MECFISLLFSCLFVSVLSFPSPVLEPRHTYKDYVYNEHTDAFYKLHREPLHRNRAEAACKAEGAELMIPTSEEDKLQAVELMTEEKIGDMVWIGQNDKPLDSEHCCNTILRNFSISAIKCTGYLPFICKAKVAEAKSAQLCPAPGYRYYPETGSCYYVPPYTATWEDALRYCREEGAHLLVLNSEQESKTIISFLKTTPQDDIHDWGYSAGFKADKPSRTFRTIFGKTVDRFWSPNEPNNVNGDEYCGCVKKDGLYNDKPCNTSTDYFICEKEVSSLQTTTSSASSLQTPTSSAVYHIYINNY